VAGPSTNDNTLPVEAHGVTRIDDGSGGRLLDRRAAAKFLVGFLLAAVLVYLLGAVVGWDETVRQLRAADLRWVAVGCLSTVLCLAAWTKTWQAVIGALGVTVTYRQLVTTFFAATFANYVTPMGQAGGEPFIAYVLASETEANYEESLASVVTADLLRTLPFFNVGIVGVGYLVLTRGLSEQTEEFAAAIAALALGLPLGVALLWRHRRPAEARLLDALAPVVRRTPRVDLASVRARIDRLVSSLEVIAGARRPLAVAVGFAYVGWVLFTLPLYFAGLALGFPLPLLLVAFLVPVTVIAGSSPTPGGLAAIEGTLVVLLVALTALSAGEALAVTTVYRLASYWLVVAVGGLAALRVLRRA
jgi:uncharacterized protein (TIRG00374 family)